MTSEKNKLKVVLDTNVYISALLFSGVPEEIIGLARAGRIGLLVSPTIMLELGRILQDKFGFSRRETLYAVSGVRRIARIIVPKIKLDIVDKDESDNRILECAEAGGADYIITGDKKHLRPLARYKNIIIRTPSEFIKEAKI